MDNKPNARKPQPRMHSPLPLHLELYSVELVKASPGAAAGQPLEELAHGLVVQAIRAVEHHTL